mmetsp:Transcript_83228/g.235561  ORF Transcript_83228/g.235561 Transcript_83228/m.235561 type:complete len:202 (+) Transcript_83228:257-862(+)
MANMRRRALTARHIRILTPFWPPSLSSFACVRRSCSICDSSSYPLDFSRRFPKAHAAEKTRCTVSCAASTCSTVTPSSVSGKALMKMRLFRRSSARLCLSAGGSSTASACCWHISNAISDHSSSPSCSSFLASATQEWPLGSLTLRRKRGQSPFSSKSWDSPAVSRTSVRKPSAEAISSCRSAVPSVALRKVDATSFLASR